MLHFSMVLDKVSTWVNTSNQCTTQNSRKHEHNPLKSTERVTDTKIEFVDHGFLL